jgi:hypothetical protein
LERKNVLPFLKQRHQGNNAKAAKEATKIWCENSKRKNSERKSGWKNTIQKDVVSIETKCREDTKKTGVTEEGHIKQKTFLGVILEGVKDTNERDTRFLSLQNTRESFLVFPQLTKRNSRKEHQ